MSYKRIPYRLSFLFTIALIFACQTVHAQNATEIYERTVSAVVLITCSDAQHNISQGSGVILRSDGVIATNFHVIEGATQAQVKLRNGDIYDDVSIIDTDERKDIAILKIKAINLPALPVADSDVLRVGDAVYVISAPYGLEGSLSSGLVSGIRAGDDIAPSLSGFRVIQFTAPISHGSSGGALLDSSGKLIGLVFAARTNSQNLNLAIPVNYVTPLAANSQGEGRRLARLVYTPAGQPARPASGTVEEIAGTYTGRWQSDVYNAGGVLVLTVTVINGQVHATVSLAGSDMFRQDTLIVSLTQMGAGVWKMDYKSKNGKIRGTGFFRGDSFAGDYSFSKFIWHDNGEWVANR